MKYFMMKMVNGKVSCKPLSEEIAKTMINDGNPCWGKGLYTCGNATPCKCQKIKDINKHPQKYDFVQSAILGFDKNGKLDNYTVLSCNNFDPILNEPSITGPEAYNLVKSFNEDFYDNLKLLELYNNYDRSFNACIDEKTR